MRVRSLTLTLALAIGCTAVGCKSAPKLPWFGAKDSAAATATTATEAPQLPSEIAKKAEGLAANPVNITTSPTAAATPAAASTAPSYTATSINAYPNTGVKSYLPSSTAPNSTEPGSTASSSIAATASTTPNSMATQKSALPYDPNSVPPAPATLASTAAPTTPAAPIDRYGMSSADRYTNAYPTTSAISTTTPASTSVSTNIASTTTTSGVPFASNPESATLGDRYATQAVPAGTQVSTASPNLGSSTVQPASAIASLQPYRPGGTTSYPGTSANYEVATRPGATTATGTNPGVYR